MGSVWRLAIARRACAKPQGSLTNFSFPAGFSDLTSKVRIRCPADIQRHHQAVAGDGGRDDFGALWQGGGDIGVAAVVTLGSLL